MEEKLKAADGPSGDSEVHLFQRCQELQTLVQEREEVIARLELQLEEQVEQQHLGLKSQTYNPLQPQRVGCSKE